MGTINWDQIRALPDYHSYEVQISYVDGYILALEDTLKDLKAIEEGWKANSFGPFKEAIKAVRASLVRSLTEAVHTKGVLQATRSEILRGNPATDPSIDVPS